jgi:hypothetical protein
MKLEFSRQIFEKDHISSFIKIRPVGVELFHADGKDMTKLTVAIRNFVNAPKNCTCHFVHDKSHFDLLGIELRPPRKRI